MQDDIDIPYDEVMERFPHRTPAIDAAVGVINNLKDRRGLKQPFYTAALSTTHLVAVTLQVADEIRKGMVDTDNVSRTTVILILSLLMREIPDFREEWDQVDADVCQDEIIPDLQLVINNNYQLDHPQRKLALKRKS